MRVSMSIHGMGLFYPFDSCPICYYCSLFLCVCTTNIPKEREKKSTFALVNTNAKANANANGCWKGICFWPKSWMSVSVIESRCRFLSLLTFLSLPAQQSKETMLTIQTTITTLPSQSIFVHPWQKVSSPCHGDNGFALFLLVPTTHVVDVAAAHPVEKTRENKSGLIVVKAFLLSVVNISRMRVYLLYFCVFVCVHPFCRCSVLCLCIFHQGHAAYMASKMHACAMPVGPPMPPHPTPLPLLHAKS